MKQPINQRGRGGSSSPVAIPAPFLGWNARDALDAMQPTEAVQLDNFFPTSGGVSLRNGSSAFATGLGGEVFTLAEFDAGASRKFVAAANNNIWDITAGGAGVSLASGYTNDKWQWAQFDDSSGGARMGLVNGADAPQIYNGSTIAGMTISGSGLTPANLVGINVFKNRTYFWDGISQDFWYSATNALGGALTKFPLGRVSGFGGDLIAMGTWNVDGGDGVDDLAVFIMSSGDVIVYKGDDPGSSWALIGVYHIGAPLSIRSIVKIANDLVITTMDGYVPLSKVLRDGRLNQTAALSDRIRNAVLQSITDSSGNYGWESIHYPKGNMALFNVPVSSAKFEQHVVNTDTGAWCRFKGWNARAFGMFNDGLYFGLNGTVQLADTGRGDDGVSVVATGQIAWNHLGARGINKLATAARLFGSTNSSTDLPYSLDIGVDFTDPSGGIIDESPAVSGGEWDVSAWDTTDWPKETRIVDAWESATAYGDAFSAKVNIESATIGFDWYSTTFIIKPGGLI